MVAEAFEEGACADNAGIGVVGVEDLAVADDVVADDDGAGMGEFEGPLEVGGVVGFVGVEEDEVEGGFVVGVQAGEGFECGANALIDEMGEAGVVDVGGGDTGVGGVEFEGDELAVWRKCAGEPDGTVAAEGPDFEDAFCALHACEQVEEFALVGGDVDGGKTGAGVCLDCFVERFVGVNESVCDVVVDGGPKILIHTVKNRRTWPREQSSEQSRLMDRRRLIIRQTRIRYDEAERLSRSSRDGSTERLHCGTVRTE
jgi:hypothetical protein